MPSWLRIALGVSAIALVVLGFVTPRRTGATNPWMRWLPPVVVVLAAIGIMAPDAAIVQVTQPAVFAVALLYAWLWFRMRRKGA